jgi:transcription antitermination factor NusG
MLLEWYIYYTYPKSERIIKKEFDTSNFEVFLPLHKVQRQWSDRVKILEVPLFPNYIFIRSRKNDIYSIIKHPRIVKYVAFEGRPARIKDEEIFLIQKLLSTGNNIKIDSSITVGDKVKIKMGPLQGFTGVLVEKKGSKRFGIKLSEFNNIISIEVELGDLERVGASEKVFS